MPLAILHFADLHLDASFSASRLPPEIGRRCREQQRHALQTLLHLASERRADAVTIAGDLFDNVSVQHSTLRFLAEQFAGINPIPIFIAPGLDDHAGRDSAYTLQPWPANVHIFFDQALTDRPLSSEYELWGAARLHKDDRRSVLAELGVLSAEKIPILLLHAAPSTPAKKLENKLAGDRPAELSATAIARHGFVAALLGGSHRRDLVSHENCVMVSPGSTLPLGFDSAEEHGAAWVTFSPGQHTVIEWLPVKQLDFKTIDVPVDNEQHVETLVTAITQALKYQSLRDCIVRVRLGGHSPLILNLDAQAVARQIQHHCAYLQIDVEPSQAAQAASMNPFAQEPTVRGALVREMLASRAHENALDDLHRDMLIYGIQAFEQENIVLR
jgi:DNA repair exonuclease SbcCD nuclease subunit